MDNLVQTLVTQAPNLLLAVWFIIRQQKTIDALLENQTKLIDRLLGYVDKDKQVAAQVIASSASAPNGVVH